MDKEKELHLFTREEVIDCIKASLDKAAYNADYITDCNGHVIDRDTITDPANIILIK